MAAAWSSPGFTPTAIVPFEVSPMRRKELAIFNVRRSNHESHAALEMLVERTAWFAPLVTHTRPLEDIAEAFAMAENYTDGVGKTGDHAGAFSGRPRIVSSPPAAWRISRC